MKILKGPMHSGHELDALGAFRVETMSLTLEERKSTASCTVGPEETDTPVGAWVLDEDEPGAGIIWRVKSADSQYDTGTRTLQMEHIVQTLKDRVLFGEITPADITGVTGATSCSAQAAITYILGQHEAWTLGSFAGEYSNVSGAYSFNGDTLMSALETVLGTLEDCYLEFDLTSYPFEMSVLKLDTSDIDCEMRMSRNIQTLRKTIDRNRMYTRLYPIGENDLHIDGNYVSQNEQLYGQIAKVETNSGKKTKAALQEWAENLLARHCEPSVTVTISGLELSASTGEALDHIRVNTRCRVPLPEYGTVITERVIRMNWPDKKNEPQKVTVTLANELADVASIVNRISSAAKSAARAQAKKDEEDHAWIVDDKNHIALVAEKVFGNSNWSQVSSLVVDGDGIYGTVTRTKDDMLISQGKLIVEHDRAGLFVTGKDSREYKYVASYSALPDSSHALTNKIYVTVDTGKYYEWKNGSWHELNPDDLNGYRTAEIVTAINDDGSTDALINADHVRIGGNQSAYTLSGAFTYEDGKLTINDAGGLYTWHSETVDGVETWTQVGVWDKGELTGGMMVSQINGQTTTRIKGNKINIGNSDGTSAVSINDAFEISTKEGTQSVKIKKQTWVNSNLYLDGNLYQDLSGDNYIQTTKIRLVGASSSQGASTHDLTDSDIKEMVIKASVSGDTLTLWTKGSNTAQSSGDGIITFRKAVDTIKGTWANGVYTVSKTAAASGGVTPPISTILGESGRSWNGNTCTVSIGEEDVISGNYMPIGLSIQIDASGRYMAGYNQGVLDLKNAGGQLTATANGTTTPEKYVSTLIVNVPDRYQTGYNQGVLDLKNAGGQVTVTANGTTTPNKYVTSLVVNVPAPTPAHSISGFSLSAPANAGMTIGNDYYSNNSDGYYISSTGRNAIVLIIADGTWSCDGVSGKTGRSYLQTAAQNVYKKGYDNGQANVSISVTEFTAYADSGETYQSWTNNSDGYWANGSASSPDAVIVIGGRVKVNGSNYSVPNNYIRSAATALYKAGMVKGWNYYEGRNWYLPSDTPPRGYASGKFWMPSPCNSWDDALTYTEWTRGTNAWNRHIGANYTKINMDCISAENQGGNVTYTMRFSGRSYSFSSGSDYDFYY